MILQVRTGNHLLQLHAPELGTWPPGNMTNNLEMWDPLQIGFGNIFGEVCGRVESMPDRGGGGVVGLTVPQPVLPTIGILLTVQAGEN